MKLGILGEIADRCTEEASGRLLTGGEEKRRGPYDCRDFGRRPVGVASESKLGQDVGPGFTPAVLDVGREVVVEPVEGIETGTLLAPELTGRSAEPEAFAEPLMLRLRHTEEVGDDEQRERLRVRADELAAAVGEELVELLIGEAPHERLVLLQAFRREQPHQQRPLPGVLGRVHGHHVLVHRQPVPEAIDELTDVVTFQRLREGRERTHDGVARRERLDVAVDLERLVVSRDRHHSVMRERRHRALRPQVLEVGVRILEQRLVGEEVDLFEISRHETSRDELGS